ncbi:TonB-dependent receptor [Alteromonas lipolytica]|uniref:TonB-dependent receptor n=1 Tax=Alteromonas lipolytica TaxID=1856405 RepID=A0A1E8FB13_9ALTE|nr:TonB-dependent receptor [Alteromonas lipolytica]OFI32798.1 TonB-dependent receptor [Alteromonas lipolytica]GGF72889.1 TonB-dependent receptor [Alteromonas lipolytica]
MRTFKLNAVMACLAFSLPVYAQQAEQQDKTAETQPVATDTEQQANNQEQDLEIIQVKGVKTADLKARDLERMKDGFSSVISTDELGNFVDQNVAESLRRLPGVTLQRSEGEGKFVAVRGLGPSFVTVNMNGAEMAGAGEDRAVGLDAIPADLLGTIEVLKSLTPDQNLNSIGGTVNVKAISAFDRGKSTLNLKVQDAYNELRESHSPRFSLNGTQLLFDNTIGLGFAVSYEDRETLVDETRHHSSNEMKFYQADFGVSDEDIAAGNLGPEILGPAQLEYRREIADRTRTAGALNVEYQPSDNAYYYVKGTYTKYEDGDFALREFYDFQDAGSFGNEEILFVNGDTKEFILSDIDVFHQHFIQESTNETTTFSLGGRNTFNDSWTLDYEYAKSKSEEDSRGDRRVQFRERDLIVYGQGGRRNISARVMSPEEAATFAGLPYTDGMFGNSARGDASDLNNWQFDNLFLEGGLRVDDLESWQVNLRKDVYNDYINYIKVGGLFTTRYYARDKNRWSFDPSPEDCSGDQACIDAVNSSLADYPSAIPAGSDFQYPFESAAIVDAITDVTRQTVELATNGEESIESTKGDYAIDEDTKAIYAMTEFPLGMDATIITGVRWVETEFASTGFMSLENDDFEFNGAGNGSLDIAIPLPEASIKYSEFFPSVHLRYEPTENILVRGAIWSSFTRPSFSQARAYATFDSDIELCPPGSNNCDDSQGGASIQQLQDYILASDNTLDVGNPNLTAMTSINYDASLSWYASENLFMEIGVFYKDIENFIIEVNGIGMSLADLPVTLPVNQVTEFVIPQDLYMDEINITLNGDKAKVYGIELSYNQYFENGFFVQSNATFLNSDARLDGTVRQGSMPLPDQADQTFNLTVGWENEVFSARLITNYRSEILEQIGSCPETAQLDDVKGCKIWGDQYQAGYTSVDAKFKYDLTENIQLYFDALNLTSQEDLRFFKGNEYSGGNILYQKEVYGQTYQLGATIKFY